MASVLMRRSLATASIAALATAVAPMAVSLAAPSAFAASSITTDPPPDSNNVVPANRPKVIAKFTDQLASGSVTLTVKGSHTNICGASHVDHQTVSCTPTSDLDTTKTYDAFGQGTDSAGHKAKTSTLEFTVDYPVLDGPSSFPIPNGSETQGNETLVAAWNEGVGSATPANAFELFEVNADGSRGNRLPGTVTFGKTVLGASDDTVSFKPAFTLANGKYEAHVVVNGVKSNGDVNPAAIGVADYNVYVDNSAPVNLTAPPYANDTNDTAFPLSGFAAPGLTVDVSVTDPGDPNPITNTATGSTTVAPCPTAPSCPWTAKVDVSGFTSPETVPSWSASTQDANKKAGGTNSNGPAFKVDYSAPPQPTVNPAPAMDNTHATVSVNGQDSATDVSSYLVTITDPDGHKVNPTIPAQNNNLPATNVDVSTLDDGQLSIIIQAVDNAGNLSKAQSTPFHVTKDVGLEPNLGTSTLSSSSGDISFVDAESQAVLSPTTVTLSFTQPVKLSWTPSNDPTASKQNSVLCIASQNGNCLTGGSPTVSSDNKSLILKVNSTLQDGTYQIRARTFSKNNCPDASVQNQNPQCEKYDSVVMTGPGSTRPFTLTIDSTKPTVKITSYTHPVTANNIQNVSVSGTVDKDVSSVQLLIKSSGSTTAKLLTSATPTQPSDPNATLATWSASPLDLSTLPDGTLTFKATAKKGNGLQASDTVHGRMAAHASTLTEVTSRRTVRLGRSITISGHLTDAAHNAISHADIHVRPRFASGRLGKSVTVATNGGGAYSATFVPKHNATYIAKYDGAPEHDGATANTAQTLVRVAVSFTAPANGSKQSNPVTLKGQVGPNKRGRTVAIYRHTGQGNTLLGRVKLNRHSRFHFRAVLPPGTNKVFAKVGKTATNLGGKSGLLTIRVG